MAHPTILQPKSEELQLPWSWCGRCQRVYVTGTCRVIRFSPNALHPHPAALKLCPYADCQGSTIREGWPWTYLRLAHPDYPAQPQPNMIYVH
jgi:hypothetical protein